MSSFYQSIQPEDIPVPPEINLKIIEACTQEDIDVDALASLISANPIISAHLLSLVNSAYYGFSQTITSISHAVVGMGLDVVKNLTLCFAIKDSFSESNIEHVDTYQFWKLATYRAVACQMWCEKLSEERLSQDELSQAFTLGLLGDIGLLILFMMETEKADRWELLIGNAPSARLRMEIALFNTDHCTVGSQIVEKWNLPKAFIDPIKYHHDKPNVNLLTRALFLADWSVAMLHSADQIEALTVFKSEQLLLDSESFQLFFKSLTDKVSAISDSMQLGKLSQMDLDEIYQNANMKLAKDNISYQELTWRLQQTLQERDEYADRLHRELSVAREIQQSLQSDTSYREHVAAINIPAKQLSGDFFDYYEHSNESITFCLGDVSGKGTHAALVMAKTISLFRCLSKVEHDLTKVVRLINDEICETSIRGMFVTFVAGRLNLNQCALEIVNAGHIPPLQVGEKSIKQIEPHGPPLGVLEEFEYTTDAIPFDNHRLYLYTDGITEATKENGEELGTKEFVQWILQSKHLDLNEQLQWLTEKFETEIHNWQDDITMMMLSSRC